MKVEYQNMMGSIHVPEGLQRRALEAAREENAAERAARRRVRPAFRAVACAVLALALVAGGVTLYPRREVTMEATGVDTVPPLTYAFGLAAHAADAAKLLSTANSGIVFHWVENRGQFRITGENIAAITLSVDQGVLWRAGNCFGSSVEERFDPSAVYGLAPLEGENIDTLDGGTLTLTVRFADGTEDTERYNLTMENLRVSRNADGDSVLVPALVGDPMGLDAVLYAAPEDSVYFLWPMEGAHTVSLSAPYGLRADGAYFHSGIDIPAQQGTSVLAAAAGTVTEAGFEAARGNYLVLDHGDGMETVYAHCLRLAAEVGDAVAAGEEIAAVGATGMATGPHLHFEVRQAGEAQNPIAFFDAAVRDMLKMG